MWKLVVVSVVLSSVGACTSPRPFDPNGLQCGPGTERVDNVCLPVSVDAGNTGAKDSGDTADARHSDAGPGDAGVPDARVPDARVPDARMPDARVPDAAVPDAAVPTTPESTNFAINAAHDNAQPADSVQSPLAPRWTASFTGTVLYPLVIDGLVIVTAAESQPNVRALDINTGARVWGPLVFGSPVTIAYDSGRVYALDQDGHLTALDVMTGIRLWSIQIPGQPFYWSPPVAAGGMVYVNGLGSGGTTVAIDGQTGTVRWQAGTFDGSDGCVAVAGGVVYEAEACDQLTAWNALTGVRLWMHSGNCTGGGGAAPAFYDNMIWERDWAEGNIVIDHNGNAVGTFAASAIPAFHAGTVFYQSGGTVSAVDIATDTLLWSFAGDGHICTSPVVAGAGAQVFVGSSSGNVYELDEATGAQRSVHQLSTPVTCFSEDESMAIGEGRLVVPAGNDLAVY